MPNRIIRESLLESEPINQLEWASECFFVRLMLKADDFGRFHADLRLLKSYLYPLKPEIRETDISRWIAACEKAGVIAVYEVGGKRYIQIPKFGQRTRSDVSKFPDPCPSNDGHMSDRCPSNDGGSRTSAHGGGDGIRYSETIVGSRKSEAGSPYPPPEKMHEYFKGCEGCDYTLEEVKVAVTALNARKTESGFWQWGKGVITANNWHSAVETKIQDRRDKLPEKKQSISNARIKEEIHVKSLV